MVGNRSRRPNGKCLSQKAKLKEENYLLAKNTSNAVITTKLKKIFEDQFTQSIVLHLQDALEDALDKKNDEGKIFGCFLTNSHFFAFREDRPRTA